MTAGPGGAGHGSVLVALAASLPWPMPIILDFSGIPRAEQAGHLAARLRSRPGIVIFYSMRDGKPTPVQVTASGDVRAFVERRLGGDGPRVDFSGEVAGALACECGSGFEADLARAAVARVLMPGETRRAAGVLAYVHLDPGSNAPACRVVEEPTRFAARALIGPFARRAHAEAFAAMLDARFSLCREPATLAGWPDAIACSYKEMGSCPAPCDGSETMESYRARVGLAVSFDGGKIAGVLGDYERAIKSASASMDFEGAAGLTRERVAMADAAGPMGSWITTMDRFGVLAVMPTGKSGWARIFIHRGGKSRPCGDVRASGDDPAGVAWQMTRLAMNQEPDPGRVFSADDGEAVALIYACLRTSRKIRGTMLQLDSEPSKDVLERAIRRAASRGGAKRSTGVQQSDDGAEADGLARGD